LGASFDAMFLLDEPAKTNRDTNPNRSAISFFFLMLTRYYPRQPQAALHHY
jgi:hypothetical protein